MEIPQTKKDEFWNLSYIFFSVSHDLGTNKINIKNDHWLDVMFRKNKTA